MKLFKPLFIASLMLGCCLQASAKGTQHGKHHLLHHARKKVHHYLHFAKNTVAPPKNSVTLPATIEGVPQLKAALEQLINTGNSNANVAVYVKSMRGRDVIYTRNIHQPLAPASTLKILTAEAALLHLGPDYRFATQLYTDASVVKNGVLEGNLYIVLSGDPTLTFYDVVDLLIALKNQQITTIAGNVYIDSTAYDTQVYGPGWEGKDKEYCYAAPISASIINHNCISMKVAAAKSPGRVARVVTSPKYFYPKIINSVMTKSVRRNCSLHLSTEADSTINLDGCVGKDQSYGFNYVVTAIPEYDRALFKYLMSHIHVKVTGHVTFGATPSNLTLIGTHASEPLRVLIVEMLKKSDNVFAGAIFKKLGQSYTQQPGSWENGSYAVTQILAKQAGVDTRGMRILDGSGLSPHNLTTPAQLMQVLEFAYHHYQTSYEFVSALPVSGVDGTLKNRMSNITRKVRAKTGTISDVVSLAGYVVSADKETLAFVIMVNGAKGNHWRYRELEDDIATALTRFKRSSSEPHTPQLAWRSRRY